MITSKQCWENIYFVAPNPDFIFFKRQGQKSAGPFDIHQIFFLHCGLFTERSLHHCETHHYPVEEHTVYLTLPEKSGDESQFVMAGLKKELQSF